MRAWFQTWLPLFKALLALAIVVAIGWRFARDLREPAVWQRSVHPDWLVLSVALYVLALGSSVVFWYRLLRVTGQQPSVPAVIRAYYIGLLGKYLPGKAWALLVRASLARGPRVRLGVAGFTAFYEVLTTMASGVLLAAVLFAVLPFPETAGTPGWPILRLLFTKGAPQGVMPERKSVIELALILFAILSIPLLPHLFNRVVQRLSSFKRLSREPGEPANPPLPHLPITVLPEGVLITMCGWLLMGTSVWAMLQAGLSQPLPWKWDAWLLATASLALAYVAGFIILPLPSGLGVREAFLMLFLVPGLGSLLPLEDAKPLAVWAVLFLRLAWTAAEVIVVAVVWWFPGPKLEKVPPPKTAP